MTQVQARLPQAFHDHLASLQGWLASLADSGPDDPPKLSDCLALEGHFRGLWQATGMDATLGLARSTPDHRLFRTAVGHYLWQSTLVRRCFEKPRGYAGDYLMMDAACNQPPAARSPLGHWMNHWFHQFFPPSLAARSRRDTMARLIVSGHESGASRVLAFASGGS